LSQNFGEHSAVLKTRSAAALQRSGIRRRSFLDDFDSADAMENCLPNTSNDAKVCTSNHERKSDDDASL